MNSQPSLEDYLEIGTIVAAQGLKGELRVYPSTDFPERFEEPGLRWLQYPNQKDIQPIQLLKGHQIPGKELYLIHLEGIENRTQAETLRGCKLLVLKRDRLPLEEDEYHVADLVDLEVYNQLTGEIVGVVVDVFSAGNDLLEVQLNNSPADKKPKTVLIPFVKEIVPEVNLKAGRLEITPPPGLLEVN